MMKDGRIFADGPKKELLAPEKLRALFGVDVTLVEHDGSWHSW
jgi:ABC-type cobalamin/Fe3+-siderophores transport system ATPase subunit